MEESRTIVCDGDCERCDDIIECSTGNIDVVVNDGFSKHENFNCDKSVSAWDCEDNIDIDGIYDYIDECVIHGTKYIGSKRKFHCTLPNGFTLIEYANSNDFANDKEMWDYCRNKIAFRLYELESYCNAERSYHADKLYEAIEYNANKLSESIDAHEHVSMLDESIMSLIDEPIYDLIDDPHCFINGGYKY